MNTIQTHKISTWEKANFSH